MNAKEALEKLVNLHTGVKLIIGLVLILIVAITVSMLLNPGSHGSKQAELQCELEEKASGEIIIRWNMYNEYYRCKGDYR